jgi:hypothetical protein
MEEKYKWLKKLSTPPHFWHGFRSLKTKVYLLRVPLWVPTKGDPPVTATWCHPGEERPSPTLCEQDSPFLCWTWVQSVRRSIQIALPFKSRQKNTFWNWQPAKTNYIIHLEDDSSTAMIGLQRASNRTVTRMDWAFWGCWSDFLHKLDSASIRPSLKTMADKSLHSWFFSLLCSF